jgi:hypothetical protein
MTTMAIRSNAAICALVAAIGCGKPAAAPDFANPIDSSTDDAVAGDGASDRPPPSDGRLGDGPTGDARLVDARPIDGPAIDARPPPPIDAAPALDATAIDAAPRPPGTPGLGAHGLSFYRVGEDTNLLPISSPALTTQASGSTIIVSVGRGNAMLFALPTDNHGNTPYQIQGQVEPYVHPNEFSGTALYAFPNARGGTGFQVSTSNGRNSSGNVDEVTLAAVEVVDATRIQAFAWNEVVQPSPPAAPVPVTSKTVTTTGPATLVAFWWGDLTATVDQTVAVDSGFTVVDSVLAAGSLVQCAVAVRTVAQAGTYSVTWTATPVQGAQLWLIAAQ